MDLPNTIEMQMEWTGKMPMKPPVNIHATRSSILGSAFSQPVSPDHSPLSSEIASHLHLGQAILGYDKEQKRDT